MKKLKYYVLDVFTSERFQGNQLAVVQTEEELELDQYYDIAREFGYSETSFVHFSREDNTFRVRSFTPAKFEVIGAGHNLLGALCLAFIKKWDILNGQTDGPWVYMAGEKIPFSIIEKNGIPYLGMQQRPAEIIGAVPTGTIADAVGLDISEFDLNGWSINIVKTEVAHLMVPVKNLVSLQKAALNKKLLKEASGKFGFEGCYLFTTNQPETGYLVQSRFFNPSIGIDEDPATGTAAGPLAGYLERLNFIEKDRDYQILQGAFIDQPSIIEVRVEPDGVRVSGSSVIVMEGQLFI